MRALTFKGFLTQYVKELSQTKTLNLRILAREAEEGNYRLAAPLVLYALATEKEASLHRILRSSGRNAQGYASLLRNQRRAKAFVRRGTSGLRKGLESFPGR